MKRNNPERYIQKAVVKHLEARAKPGVLWWHTPNAPRNAITGAHLKAMGMRAGVSDLILYHNKEFFALELKAPNGRPTLEQREFIDAVRNNGGHAIVTEGLNEAIACLECWGLLR